jgi:L-threonylcarbamoyladenylate synthase
MEQDRDSIANILLDGGVGIIPTDTLYGIVGSALNADAVERIYKLKKRNKKKPLIVLIPEIDTLEQFGVVLSESLRKQLSAYWPGPYSVILPVIDEQFDYLSCGSDTIAFRVPDKQDLIELLRATGPLVAPSANTEGNPPAEHIGAAKKYFGSDVDFYVDGGELNNKPSTVLEFDGDEARIVRE